MTSLAIPVQTADGKITLLEGVQATNENEYCIPVQTADGKITLLQALPATDDVNCIRAQTADGKIVLVQLATPVDYRLSITGGTSWNINSFFLPASEAASDSFVVQWLSSSGSVWIDPLSEPQWNVELYPLIDYSLSFQLFDSSDNILIDYSNPEIPSYGVGSTRAQFPSELQALGSTCVKFKRTKLARRPASVRFYVYRWDTEDQDSDVPCNIKFETLDPDPDGIPLASPLWWDFSASSTPKIILSDNILSGTYTFPKSVTGWTPKIQLA